MKRLLPFLAVAMLSACGTTSTVKLSISAPTNPPFAVIDERHPDKKTSRTEDSYSETVSTIGEDKLEPPAADILRAWLNERLGPELTGKTIKLTEFDIRIVEPTAKVDPNALNSAAASTPGGYAAAPLAALLILGIEKVKSEKTVLVNIKGSIDQREVSSSSSERFRGRVTEDNVRTTLEAALANLTMEINSTLNNHANP